MPARSQSDEEVGPEENSDTVLNADVVGGASTTGNGNACTSSSGNGQDIYSNDSFTAEQEELFMR